MTDVNLDTETAAPEPTSIPEGPMIKRIGIMVDSESTGLKPNSAVWEVAFTVFDLDDPDTILDTIHELLPVEPQTTDMGRKIEPGWIVNHLAKQPKSTQDAFAEAVNGDLEELASLIRSLNRKFARAIEGADVYEVWFARPQHDIPLIDSLWSQVGEKLPWAYNAVNDLRTLMNLAGIPIRHPDLEPLKQGIVTHRATGDNLFQIRCLVESLRRLRARS